MIAVETQKIAGGVTAPAGFRASGVACGIKANGKPDMEMLMSELGAQRIQPVVARTFPLDKAAEAHRFIQSRQNIGKVVLTT